VKITVEQTNVIVNIGKNMSELGDSLDDKDRLAAVASLVLLKVLGQDKDPDRPRERTIAARERSLKTGIWQIPADD
jgi:hypothetical protein